MKLIRTSTIPASLNTFCRGFLRELSEQGYEVVAISSPGDDLDRIAEREGVPTIAVPMERHIAPFADLRSLIRLIKAFRRERPDIVHSITPKAGLLSMLAAWICRVPVRIHTFTGLVFPTATGLKQKILIFTDRITCAAATHIIPEGQGVRDDLIKFRITRKPLRVLGHGNIRGIDLDHFDPALFEEEKHKARPFTFIFIGRLVRDKGIVELVDAFTRLNRERPDTRLILVGPAEPDLDPLPPETLAALEANQSIQAVGKQTDVRPWLAASDVLVLPSYREGFPNVVIEAGAMGLPAVVTDINGSREIIIDGRNGLIVAPHDADALHDAMLRTVDHPEQTAQMAAAARPLIASRFEQSYVRRCLKAYYREIAPREAR